MTEKKRLDWTIIRARLSRAQGSEYWRHLEELAEIPEFTEFLRQELPRQAAVLDSGVNRRHFLKLMTASLALAGLGACVSVPPREEIVPYVRKPEAVIPGKPLFFATAMPLSGFAQGLLVESHTGRPTKIEGNPDHPDSLGATTAFAQASILTLYDPDRSQTVTQFGQISSYDDFVQAFRTELAALRANQGAGFRLLTETVTSPTLTAQIQQLLTTLPQAKWYQYEPGGRSAVYAGAQLAFGEPIDMHYNLDRADVILSIGSDFLAKGPGSLRYAREFARRRRVYEDTPHMNRLYVVEGALTSTGAWADHRLPLRPGEMENFTRSLATALGLNVTAGTLPSSVSADWLKALVSDLQGHAGASLIVVGDEQPPTVHALVHALNDALGNVGSTIVYTDPIEANPSDQMAGLRELSGDMEAGRVSLLLMLGGNPVYTAPVDLQFGERLSKVKLCIHLGLYEDETSALCHWHIPEAHYLETWGDGRASDGTASIIQPLIAPLYQGRSAHEILALAGDQPTASSYDIVRAYWQTQHPAADFESFWRAALNQGVIANTALPTKSVTLRTDWQSQPAGPSDPNALELIFQIGAHVHDGRFANNGWLQELPQPLTHLTWDNAALISPALAERLGLADEDVVELQYQARSIKAPVLIMPGHVDNAVTIQLGYGRTRAGKVGDEVGFNAYLLHTSDALWFGSGMQIRKTGEHHSLALTRAHHSMEGRDLVRSATFAEYQANPQFAQQPDAANAETQSLYPPYEYNGHAWGMAIDLSSCMGCNACVVACQAENNIPIVGKDQVLAGREMHWLRIDTYFNGSPDNPATYFEPIPCMQCENAPCEVVCPVEATVHSDEGLNDMVYNRCVGTRYCSNNCPYKVRRFNFFQYSHYDTDESLKLLANPDVTVRERGVMEKCTYCVQRINAGRITAEKEGRPVRDGEIVTACQAACPSEAIIFGDINDVNSRVHQRKGTPLNYALLSELNTRPRTTYLAEIRNPNPDLTAG